MDKGLPLVGLESNSIKSNIVGSLINEKCNLTNAKFNHEQWEFEWASSIASRNTINNQLYTFEIMQIDCSQSFTINKDEFPPKQKKKNQQMNFGLLLDLFLLM